MHLEINNFRCHEAISLEVDEGGLLLLSGASGHGKSTVLEAIEWLLYGKLQHIAPFDKKTSTTSVKLITDDFTIFRSAKPSKLIWNDDLEGSEAQETIIERFGPREIWRACCYLAQGDRTLLLTGSQQEKIDLLSYFAFSGDDPSEYIAKIAEHLHTSRTVMERDQHDFERDLDRFSQKWKSPPVKSSFRTSRQQKQLEAELEELQNENKRLSSKIIKHHQQLGARNHLLQELSHLSETLSQGELSSLIAQEKQRSKLFPEWERVMSLQDLPLLNSVQRKTYRKNYLAFQSLKRKDLTAEQLKHKIELAEQWDEKERKKKELSKIRIPSESLETYQEEQERFLQQQSISKKWKLLSKMKFRDDVPLLDRREKADYISKWHKAQDLKTLITTQEEADERKRILRKALLAIRQKKPPMPCPSIAFSELDNLKETYEEKKRGQDVLSCPHCSGSVRMSKGKLVSSDDTPCSSKELQDLQNLILALEAWKDIDKELLDFDLPSGNPKSWEKELSLLEEEVWRFTEFTPDELEAAEHRSEFGQLAPLMSSIARDRSSEIETLRRVEILKQEIDLLPDGQKDDIHSLKHDYEIRKILAEDSYLYHPDEIDGFARKVELQEYFTEPFEPSLLTLLEGEYQTALRRDEIQRSLQSLCIDEDLPENLEQNKKQIVQIETELQEAKRWKEYSDQKKELQDRRKAVEEQRSEVSSGEVLLTAAKQVESHVLAEVVDSFNVHLQEILDTMFEGHLSAEISLFRTAKTTGNTKAVVNTKIFNKGAEYDTANQLSGGEAARLSLAITLALSTMNSFPLLLLDECLANLDADNRERCLTMIKNHHCDKTVLCVLHSTVEGYFDSCLEF